MPHDNNNHNPFSLIADFDGDITTLFNVKHKGTLPVLPLRDMVLFPGVVAPIAVSRHSSQALVQWAIEQGEDTFIAVAAQVDPNVEEPTMLDIFPTATLARIMKVIEMPNGKQNVILQAFGRVELNPTPYRIHPFLRTSAESLEEIVPDNSDHDWNVLFDCFRESTLRYLEANDQVSRETIFAIKNIKNPIFFVNFVATNLPISIEDKALLLEESNMEERTFQILHFLQREMRYIELRQAIHDKTRVELDRQQREFFLQQQLKNIQQELGAHENSDVANLLQKINNLSIPESVKSIFDKEILKLERQNPASPDYNVILSYLETIVSLPWNNYSTDNMDLRRAERILNRDHFGMEKVKERILEHLAIMRVSKKQKAPILCLYGPPGVGKTSLGKSIAESLGRKYVRVSLGGLHDESEIRGHRRTYIGAMCGRIMKSIIKSGSSNPVFVLDEIDKVGGQSHNGDPQSALLELLDPEQNNAFHDNYLDFDFDLSKVFFIATANNIGNIPPALRDRMELIEVEGYLTEEKKEITKRHLIPNVLKQLEIPTPVKLSSAATDFLIEHYTRESGVRQLQKSIEKLIRKVVLERINKTDSIPSDPSCYKKALKQEDIIHYLGTPKYNHDIYQGNSYAGVVTGLAWTAVGGEILFIETSISRSKAPRLTTTGNLGDVMKESATLAVEYVKAHAETLNLDPRVFEQWNIHIHVPEGATPKDGPSAGITIATSIASALTQRKVRDHLAMTGEITLRGKVLPVGGIKEKILAAKRAGITTIILSSENKKDINDIPEKYLTGLTFYYAESVIDVWKIALLPELVPNAIDVSFVEQEK